MASELAHGARAEEFDGALRFDLDVAHVDSLGKLYLFDLENVALFLVLFVLLDLIETVLAVIEYLAHRRHRVRREKHEIEISLVSHTLGLLGGYDTYHRTVCVDQSYFRNPDARIGE